MRPAVKGVYRFAFVGLFDERNLSRQSLAVLYRAPEVNPSHAFYEYCQCGMFGYRRQRYRHFAFQAVHRSGVFAVYEHPAIVVAAVQQKRAWRVGFGQLGAV